MASSGNLIPPGPYSVVDNNYVDEEYASYNPRYGQAPTGPVWGLDRPLPRIVRPGMRRGARHDQDHRIVAYQPPQQGPTSPVPQLKTIPTGRRNDSDLSLPSVPTKGRQSTQAVFRGKDWSVRHNAYGHGGLPKVLERSVSADEGLRHYTQPQNAAQEVGHALNTVDPAHKIAGRGIGPISESLVLVPSESAALKSIPTETSTRTKSFASFQEDPEEDEPAIEEARQKLDAMAQTYTDVNGARDRPPMLEEPEALPRPQSVTPEGVPDEPQFLNRWTRIRHSCREFLAEFLGTTVGLTIGIAGTMVRTLSPNVYGNVTTSSFAWGFGIMFGIYIAGGISGGHLNPVISIVLAINRGFPVKQCGVYIVAQLLGAFTAGWICFGLYHDAILHYQGDFDIGKSGLVFYTQPKEWVTPLTAFFNEFVGTAVIAGTVLALGDDANTPAGAGMGAFIIGLLVTVMTMAFGFQTGGCFNPARDLGPRLVALIAGYGTQTFTAMNWWSFWGPWGATISGGITGAAIYDIFIFIGGESPVNFPRQRRKRAVKKFEIKCLRKLGGKRTRKLSDLEKQASEITD